MNNKNILIIVFVLVVLGLSYITFLKPKNNENLENNVVENVDNEEENTEDTGSSENTDKENEGIKEENTKPVENTNIKNNTKVSCEGNGGTWITSKNICEINSYSEAQCIDKGGEFNPCASACRNDPGAEVCTLQCVLTCTFK